MKLTIEGTSEEIKNVLQAISGSEEHTSKNLNCLEEILNKSIYQYRYKS